MRGGDGVELSELIESIDILDYISQYIEFTEKNGEYWALSPFKEENTPSFSVRRETNTFYDLSSGIGGNVLTFVRYYNKCGYQEAIETLKKYVGNDGTIVCHKRLAAAEVAKHFAPPQKAPKQAKSTTLPDDYMERYERILRRVLSHMPIVSDRRGSGNDCIFIAGDQCRIRVLLSRQGKHHQSFFLLILVHIGLPFLF